MHLVLQLAPPTYRRHQNCKAGRAGNTADRRLHYLNDEALRRETRQHRPQRFERAVSRLRRRVGRRSCAQQACQQVLWVP
eukprot:356768-Chlamydomonas_euryale.AAC.1